MLNSKKIIKTLKEKKNFLKENKVKKIGLFGSFVKNKQNKKSDIDFLVEFKNVTADNFFDLIELLEKMFRRKIDLVIERNLVPELNYVKKEAKYIQI